MSEETPNQESETYVGPETPPDEDDKSGRLVMPDEDLDQHDA